MLTARAGFSIRVTPLLDRLAVGLKLPLTLFCLAIIEDMGAECDENKEACFVGLP